MPSVLHQLKPWITAARPVGHGMIALPLLWGQGLAFSLTGQFDWLWFAVAQLFAVLIQIHTLYLNDYADEPIDRNNHDYWLSGGSRVIPDGKLTGQQLYRASFVPVAVIVMLSAAAYCGGRPWFPVFAGLALLASASYSLAPLKTSYRGLGETHQGLSCGVGLPLCAYYVQAGSLEGLPWLFLLPVFLVFFASNITTALPDLAADAEGGKRSYPVRYGAKKAKQRALLLSLLAAGLIGVFVPQAGAAIAVIGVPALLLISMLFMDSADDAKNTKRFMTLIIISHLWLMVSWAAYFFWVAQ